LNDRKVFLPYLLLCAAFGVVFYPSLKQLVTTWATSDQNSHGFLIPLVSAYIIHARRKGLTGTNVSGSRYGFVLSCFSILLYVISITAGMATAQFASIVFFVWGTFLFLFGYNGFRFVAFPLYYLLFMIPVPAQLYSMATLPLQLFVTRASGAIGSLMHIPIYVEGNLINLPGRVLEIVEACSGLRSMMSLLALSAVFGFYSLRTPWKRSVLFLSGIPIAIIINIVRILAIAVFLHCFRIDITSGPLHAVAGIAVFGISLGLIVLTSHILGRWIPET
jgi:exosortase